MPKNDAFLSLETTNAWLSQFTPGEQAHLVRMLREMRLVSASTFVDDMRTLIKTRVKADPSLCPVGLYAERETMRRSGNLVTLFTQPEKPVRSATGAGPKAVHPQIPWKQDVGSEGIVAQLITELGREMPSKVFSHPGPNEIRKHGIRRFMLVSDFIGSGKRAHDYLTAAWQAWSVRSWWSARHSKGMRFEMLAYSSTEPGMAAVAAHACRPAIHIVAPCPTIDTSFDEEDAAAIKAICIQKDPVDQDTVESLGFRGTGALIAFSHGAPNNVPRLLIESRKSGRLVVQLPLFPKRTTGDARASFSPSRQSVEDVRDALRGLGQRRMALALLPSELSIDQNRSLLVLAALGRPPRTDFALAGRTGLTILEVAEVVKRLIGLNWINNERRLTSVGYGQLGRARQRVRKRVPVPPLPSAYYYPSSLRAPVGPFSDAE